MERRKAVIAAGAVSLTLLAGAAAISLNTGLVSAEENDDGVGDLTVTTVPAATTADPGAPVQVPGDDDFDDFDDVYEDDEYQGGEYEGGEHGSEDEEREYEGAEDDD